MTATAPVGIDPGLTRELAKFELAAIAESRKQLTDEHSAAFRWLTASLLAVNGASALSLFGSVLVDKDVKLSSGLAFFVGTIAALLCSYLSQGAVRRIFLPLNQLAGYWIAVSQHGEHQPEIYEKIVSEVQQAARGSLLTRIAGWTSLVAFAVGVLGIGLRQYAADTVVCGDKPIISATASLSDSSRLNGGKPKHL